MSSSPSPDEKRPSGAPPETPKPEGGNPGADARMPPAGPHAAPHLTNPDATPGTGALPSHDPDANGEADAGTG